MIQRMWGKIKTLSITLWVRLRNYFSKSALRIKRSWPIWFGFYPYTFVRTTVMRSRLLKKQDYDKLLRMDFHEMNRFLQETSYKSEIDELAPHFSGEDLLEHALIKNLEASYDKLDSISPRNLMRLVAYLRKKKDVHNIKTVLRAKHVSLPKQELERSLVGAGTLSKEYLLNLYELDSVSEILRNLDVVQKSYRDHARKAFEKTGSFVALESILDKFYFDESLAFAKRIWGQGKMFKRFLLEEIYVHNIITLVRLKRASMKSHDIKEYLFFTKSRKHNKLLKRLLKLEDLKKMFAHLETTKYYFFIKDAVEVFWETGSLIEFETALNTYALRMSIRQVHLNPVSLDTILGYIFAKEHEVRNLSIILKAKRMHIADSFIKQTLVLPS